MTSNRPHPQGPAPQTPALHSAGEHRRQAEAAAARADFDSALRERFRAVLRGMEQRGLLPVRRSRTAHETADESRQVVDLSTAAKGFDEVVYGGRPATAAEYQLLTQADRFSTTTTSRNALTLPTLTAPEILRKRWLWLTLLVLLALALLGYLLATYHRRPAEPHAPPPPARHHSYYGGNGGGSDSIFHNLPNWLLFGGLQWLVCAAIVIWWRARRRVALVDDPLPVQAPANEVLTGRATLYRRARDCEHAAAVLRAATLRRVRPILGLAQLPGQAQVPQQQLAMALAARLGQDHAHIAAVLFGPVPDDTTLAFIAANLHHIETNLHHIESGIR